MVVDVPAHVTGSVAVVYAEIAGRLGDRFERLAGPEFEAYCGCVARLRDAQARIEAEGLIVPDGKNLPVAYPAFAIEQKCQDELRRWGAKFQAR